VSRLLRLSVLGTKSLFAKLHLYGTRLYVGGAKIFLANSPFDCIFRSRLRENRFFSHMCAFEFTTETLDVTA
jgi:hypothetical protein